MNDKLRKQIYEMWEAGHTSFDISAALGITRNSVMGIVNRGQRMGMITRRGTVGKKPKEPKAPTAKVIRLPKKPPLTTIQPPKLKKEEPMAKETKPVVVPIPPRKKTGPKTIMELGIYDCRWMMPDKRYCGEVAKSAQTPWCEEHYKLVYVRGTARRGS